MLNLEKYLRTKSVLWRTTLPLLHISEQTVYCDAPHYHFSISQNKLCTVTHLITTSPHLRTNCVLWRISLPLLHTSEQAVYCDAPHYHFSISQQQISRSSSSKYYKREKQSKLGCRLSTNTSGKALSFLLHGQCSKVSFRSLKEYKLSCKKRLFGPRSSLTGNIFWNIQNYVTYIFHFLLDFNQNRNK
jgi:hypothetical protein